MDKLSDSRVNAMKQTAEMAPCIILHNSLLLNMYWLSTVYVCQFSFNWNFLKAFSSFSSYPADNLPTEVPVYWELHNNYSKSNVTPMCAHVPPNT